MIRKFYEILPTDAGRNTGMDTNVPTEEIFEAAKEEIKSKSDLPFYHKDNVNIDLCRVMWMNGVRWMIERIKNK